MITSLFSQRNGFLLLLTCIVFSTGFGQKGKISGHVIDADAKEGLFGVNILLKGTTQGASSDLDGSFVILNVTPGTYTVVASMVGYTSTQINNVAVNIDRTTLLDISLRPSTVELSAVIVEAKQPVVVRDKTSTATTIDGRDVEKAPVEGLRDVMELNASMQRNPNGNFTVRGSGSYEVNVLVNGVEQMNTSTGVPGYSIGLGDKSNNSWKSDINPLSVQQMEIISGGFSAEYGNAQAGVVKVVTREGGPKLSGQIRYEYRPAGQYHWGDYIYNRDAIEWKKWGTLEAFTASLNAAKVDSLVIFRDYLRDPATNTIKDTLPGRDHPVTVDEWREVMWRQWVLNHTESDDNLLGAYDYRKYAYQRVLFSFGGPLGKNSEQLRFFVAGEYKSAPTRIPSAEKIQTAQNYSLSLIYQPLQTQKIRLTGTYQSYRGGIYTGSEDIRWAGRDAKSKYYLVTDPPREEYTSSQSLNWTYTISQKSFLDVIATHQFEKAVLIEQPVPQRPSQTSDWRNNIYKGQWYIAPGPWDEGYNVIYSFTTFNQQDLRTHSYSMNADYTNQFTKYHDVKMGFKATYWDMLNSAVYSSFAANAYITRTGYAEYYKSFPYYAAGYLQDKMEFEGMVANVGVRVDAYSFNSRIPADRFNPFYIAEYQAGGPAGDPTTDQSKNFLVVSPRLGLSFPVGELTAFRLQYGHFSSMPIFQQAYAGTNEMGWATRGNADLNPKKTINYELGLQHSFGGTHRLDIVGYYNDRVSQIGNLRIRALTGGTRKDQYYTTYSNNQFGSSKGVEITLEKVARERLTYRFSYSLARTTYGNYGPRAIVSDNPDDPGNYKDPYAPTDYLSYDDRTHTLRTLFSYYVEKDGGIDVMGVRPFSQVSVSLVYTAQTGSPYTYVPSYDQLITEYTKDRVSNNRRFPLEAKTDLNINKNFVMFGFETQFGLRIMNLFDNRWLTPLDYKTQQLINWVEYGVTMDNSGLENLSSPYYTKDVYKFSYFKTYRNMPRQVIFNLGFNF